MPPRKKPLDVMQKKIPTNPKYQHVQATIDTGASLTKYLKRVEELRENYRFRNDELFKRMKITTFVQLLIQVEEINLGAQRDAEEQDRLSASGYHRDERGRRRSDDESTVTGEYPDEEDDRVPPLPAEDLTYRSRGYDPQNNISTERSSLQSVIRGVGEFDITHKDQKALRREQAAAAPPFPDNLPYLLMDVRDREEFEQSHIIKAYNYPHTMLSRSVNFETKEMLACRNQPGKIIVVYDEDERLGPRVATTLFQRGYDNLFLLSGGLKVALKKFPRGLVCGTIPKSLLPPTKGKGAASRGLTSSSGTSRSVVSSAGSVMSQQRGTGKLPPSGDTMSVTSSASQQRGGQDLGFAVEDTPLRDHFTQEDLEDLAMQLDHALAMGDGASSVTSTRMQSRNTTRSFATSAAANDAYDRKPFKV